MQSIDHAELRINSSSKKEAKIKCEAGGCCCAIYREKRGLHPRVQIWYEKFFTDAILRSFILIIDLHGEMALFTHRHTAVKRINCWLRRKSLTTKLVGRSNI